MRPLEILLTNNTLADYAGSELYLRDVAIGLRQRGHKPIAYTQILGRVANELKAAGIQVVGDLRQIATVPDIIHGQHNLETMTALLHFPGTPAVYFCHGYVPWQEQPPVFPRILCYVAVDNACRDLLHERGIHPDRAKVIYNFANMQRFLPRKPLPPKPRRALVFSNYAREDNYLPRVREACRLAGISLEVSGIGSGRPCYHPEKLLPDYDLVFAKARASIEALAVGCAVITCDASGLGSLVTTANLEQLRPMNFGFRTLTRKLEVKLISAEIARYDAADAREVSSRIRTIANMEDTLDQLLTVYAEVLREFQTMAPVRETEEKAAAVYLAWLATFVKNTEGRLTGVSDKLKAENAALRSTNVAPAAEEHTAQEHKRGGARKSVVSILWPFHRAKPPSIGK